MAIINCPNCRGRLSSQKKVCPHCDFALGDLNPEEQEQMKSRRRKRQLHRAANLSYLALAFLVAGAVWWWFHGLEGWVPPPPVGGISLIAVGAFLYLVARSWIFVLRLKRNHR